MSETTRRYILFAIALMLGGFGVAIISQSSAGTTPISSFPLEVAVHGGFTLGQTTLMINALFIISQYFLTESADRNTRQNFWFLAKQIPAVVLFAASIDVGMWTVPALIPEGIRGSYLVDIVNVVVGSALIAFGIVLQVYANAAMVPGEGFVKVLARRLRKEFGRVKLFFDLSLVACACITGLLATGFTYIASVREGTVISALMIGPLIQFLMPRFKFVENYLIDRTAPQVTREIDHHLVPPAGSVRVGRSRVITVSREFGTGGHALAKKVAERLGLAFYDKDLVEMIAKESGFDANFVANQDHRPDSTRLFEMIYADYTAKVEDSMNSADALFVATSRVIRRLAAEAPCVIVGRAADQILRDESNVLRFHITADLPYKVDFCKRNYSLREDEAIARMQATDRQRAEYYLHYTGHHIADSANYDATFNVGALGEERVVNMICNLYRPPA